MNDNEEIKFFHSEYSDYKNKFYKIQKLISEDKLKLCFKKKTQIYNCMINKFKRIPMIINENINSNNIPLSNLEINNKKIFFKHF